MFYGVCRGGGVSKIPNRCLTAGIFYAISTALAVGCICCFWRPLPQPSGLWKGTRGSRPCIDCHFRPERVSAIRERAGGRDVKRSHLWAPRDRGGAHPPSNLKILRDAALSRRGGRTRSTDALDGCARRESGFALSFGGANPNAVWRPVSLTPPPGGEAGCASANMSPAARPPALRAVTRARATTCPLSAARGVGFLAPVS